MQKVESQSAIECTDVSFGYDETSVLENITLTVELGAYVGILGPNGGGKSTLLKLILGIEQPDSGSISIYGEENSRTVIREHIGYVPQRIADTVKNFPSTVKEVVNSAVLDTSLFRKISAQQQERIDAAISITNIGSLLDTHIGSLSGGQLQRVFIARALATDPSILILDEPTTGVDVTTQHQFYDFIKELNQKHGKTVLIVSHDIDTITHETNCIVCLQKNLVCCLPTSEFLAEGHMETIFGDHGTHFFHEHDEDKHNHPYSESTDLQ